MTIPRITTVRLAGSADLPLLVVGPSLGTSVTALWSPCARALAEQYLVVGWDLPGHGANTERSDRFTMTELAVGVGLAIDDVLPDDDRTSAYAYAGVSVGGAVGLELLLASPERITSAVLICTGAKIGEADGWTERAGLVRRSGTAAVVDTSIERWFGPGFVERRPAVASSLLDALRAAAPQGYGQVCDALALFDVRRRLGAITSPVLSIAGSADIATPVADLAMIVDGVVDGRLAVLDGVGHLAPAERPDEVAELIAAHIGATQTPPAGRHPDEVGR